MKRNKLTILLFISVLLFFTACSSTSENSKMESADSNEDGSLKVSNDFAESDNDMDNSAGEEVESDTDSDHNEQNTEESANITSDRMIINQAHLHINVNNLEKAQTKIEKKVNKYDGYIVESSIYRDNDEHANGDVTVRVPAKNFQKFLTDSEEVAVDVLERNITGEDVTEKYVDLESRVKSKRAVEERLLEFMKEAEKTEDLLKISNDLSAVQEDIEVIVGKINYLENQTSYSTIEISMYEDRVVIPELENKNLNTWEKTKKQLTKSVNFILATSSGFIVFFIGNLPVIIILSVIGIGIYFFIKRYHKKFNQNN